MKNKTTKQSIANIEAMLEKLADMFLTEEKIKKIRAIRESAEIVGKSVYPQEYCLHKTCIGCKSGTCNGVHMISCPCSNCSPR